MPVKSFRGLMTDPAQQRIYLHTNSGRIGYRIVKFQVMPHDVDGSTTHEASMQIWKVKQTTPVPDLNFSDNKLLAAVYYIRTTSGGGTPTAVFDNQTVIFANEVFNQDIYVVYQDGQTGQEMNYYLELEQFAIDSDEATVATLKNMRNTSSPG